MIKEILLPDLGEGIEGADVSEVVVSVGDSVSKDDTLLVLESDKASMEIPAEEPGVIKEILVSPGDNVVAGALLLKMEISEKNDSKKTNETKNTLSDLLLPDLGEGIEGADVSEVVVSVGDSVSKDDTLLVLESDKASMEIPAEEPGVIKEILVSPGDNVVAGSLLMRIQGQASRHEEPHPEDTPKETVKETVKETEKKRLPGSRSFF